MSVSGHKRSFMHCNISGHSLPVRTAGSPWRKLESATGRVCLGLAAAWLGHPGLYFDLFCS